MNFKDNTTDLDKRIEDTHKTYGVTRAGTDVAKALAEIAYISSEITREATSDKLPYTKFDAVRYLATKLNQEILKASPFEHTRPRD